MSLRAQQVYVKLLIAAERQIAEKAVHVSERVRQTACQVRVVQTQVRQVGEAIQLACDRPPTGRCPRLQATPDSRERRFQPVQVRTDC